jgi:hypothetical protein
MRGISPNISIRKLVTLCLTLAFVLSIIPSTLAYAGCGFPTPRIELINFTKNAEVLIDHTKSTSHEEIKKERLKKQKRSKKSMARTKSSGHGKWQDIREDRLPTGRSAPPSLPPSKTTRSLSRTVRERNLSLTSVVATRLSAEWVAPEQ